MVLCLMQDHAPDRNSFFSPALRNDRHVMSKVRRKPASAPFATTCGVRPYTATFD